MGCLQRAGSVPRGRAIPRRARRSGRGETGKEVRSVSGGGRRRLVRSTKDRKLAGVCGGLAEYFGLDPALVRLLAIVACIAYPPLVLAYVLAIFVVPEGP